MRLSDVKGERVFDVIADLIEPVASIATDENVSKLFEKATLDGGDDKRGLAIDRIRKYVPSLIREHRDEMCLVLATIKGVTVEEYVGGMTMSSLIGDVMELLNDQEFLSFFA